MIPLSEGGGTPDVCLFVLIPPLLDSVLQLLAATCDYEVCLHVYYICVSMHIHDSLSLERSSVKTGAISAPSELRPQHLA